MLNFQTYLEVQNILGSAVPGVSKYMTVVIEATSPNSWRLFQKQMTPMCSLNGTAAPW